MDQKDRVKERESRRSERKDRILARVNSGESGPPMGEPMPPLEGPGSAEDVAPAPETTT
jgi:hypothetical protein